MCAKHFGGRTRHPNQAQSIVARMYEFYDALNRGDASAMGSFISPAYVEHFGAPTAAGIHLTPEEFQARRRQGREALDGLFIEVVQIIPAANTARPTLTSHVIIHGRQLRPYGVLPLPEDPSEDLALEAISILVFDEGGERFIEHWETQNVVGVLQRRGLQIVSSASGESTPAGTIGDTEGRTV